MGCLHDEANMKQTEHTLCMSILNTLHTVGL